VPLTVGWPAGVGDAVSVPATSGFRQSPLLSLVIPEGTFGWVPVMFGHWSTVGPTVPVGGVTVSVGGVSGHSSSVAGRVFVPVLVTGVPGTHLFPRSTQSVVVVVVTVVTTPVVQSRLGTAFWSTTGCGFSGTFGGHSYAVAGRVLVLVSVTGDFFTQTLPTSSQSVVEVVVVVVTSPSAQSTASWVFTSTIGCGLSGAGHS
jgi:hypothetical protein